MVVACGKSQARVATLTTSRKSLKFRKSSEEIIQPQTMYDATTEQKRIVQTNGNVLHFISVLFPGNHSFTTCSQKLQRLIVNNNNKSP